MTGTREKLDPDNPNQELIHICPTKAQRILNPIIDWSDEDVWAFIKGNNIRYCELYDHGYNRLGCVGCPMSCHRAEELEAYPKIKQAYIRAFDRMLEERKKAGLIAKTEAYAKWKTGEDVMQWWLDDTY